MYNPIVLLHLRGGCPPLEKISGVPAYFTRRHCRFYVIFPEFRKVRRADSMYIYHYTLAFEPDFILDQRSTFNSECSS